MPRFSVSKSFFTSSCRFFRGQPSFHNLKAILRVLVQMPARSINLNCGSTLTTTIEPGGEGLCIETKGWSIHPPARASLYGSFPITSSICLLFFVIPFQSTVCLPALRSLYCCSIHSYVFFKPSSSGIFGSQPRTF